jgi:hypothetical protein
LPVLCDLHKRELEALSMMPAWMEFVEEVLEVDPLWENSGGDVF